MKWFQHQSNAHRDFNTEPLIEKYGIEGYGLYWICGEIVAEKGNDYKIKADKGWKRYLISRTRFAEGKLNEILGEMAELDLINKTSFQDGDLYMPKMEKYSDDYTKKLQRVSEQDTDSVRTFYGHNPKRSGIVRQEEIRVDKIRVDKNRETTSLNYLSKIPEKDMKEILQRFNLTKQQVESKAEDLINYCKAKGRVYKNYKAFLLNALKKDFGKREKEPYATFEGKDRKLTKDGDLYCFIIDAKKYEVPFEKIKWK